jgi:Ca-activated chloride channel family protein
MALGAALVLATAALGAQGQVPPQQPPQPVPSFKAGVEVVSLSVTVTDPGSKFVTDLDRGDFTVFEDGVKQDLVFFTKSNLPIALSILLDTSASMEDRLPIAQAAASGFARRLKPQDLAQVVDFDSKVEIVQGFTNDHKALDAAINRTTAGGSTSLYNALYISLKELKKVQARSTDEVRRQAIVILSDGEDTSSLVSFDEVLDLAKRSETAIYTIALRTRDNVSASRGFKEAEFVLRQLAQETGGRSFSPSKAEELPAVYDQISEELSSQYLMGYSSRNPKRDGVWRRIVVRVGRANVTARTKQGYYAPTAR